MFFYNYFLNKSQNMTPIEKPGIIIMMMKSFKYKGEHMYKIDLFYDMLLGIVPQKQILDG